MSEEKTIEQLLKEKKELTERIESDVNLFLKNNPLVYDISFKTRITLIETRCDIFRDINLNINIEL